MTACTLLLHIVLFSGILKKVANYSSSEESNEEEEEETKPIVAVNIKSEPGTVSSTTNGVYDTTGVFFLHEYDYFLIN